MWTTGDLPRTEGTRKLKRAAIREWVQSGAQPGRRRPAATRVEALIARFAHGRDVSGATTLEELGLSSLERVELMVALEDRVSDAARRVAVLAKPASVADLKPLVEQPAPADEVATSRWTSRRGTARGPCGSIRRLSQATWILPLARVFAWARVDGREHLTDLDGPVIFAVEPPEPHRRAGHPGGAARRACRARVAPAMAKEFFKAHFFPAGYSVAAALHQLGSTTTSRRSSSTRSRCRSARPARGRRCTYIGELTGDGWSVLIFPEGERSATGEIKPFRGGIGMMASRLDVPVVPVRLDGVDRVLHPKAKMATAGPGAGGVRRAACACAATTTRRSPRQVERRGRERL